MHIARGVQSYWQGTVFASAPSPAAASPYPHVALVTDLLVSTVRS